MVSMFNDHYYGQWLAMHHAFHKLEDLLPPAIVGRVPDHLKFLACALHLAPDMWKNHEAIRRHMQDRAHRNEHIDTVIAMIQSQTFFIEQHLHAHMERPLIAESRPAFVQHLLEEIREDDIVLSPEQRRFEAGINMRVDQALKVRSLEIDSAEMETLMSRMEEHACMIAGSGKTVVLDRCIRRAVRNNARVLVTLPTGAQRARMRQRHPDVDMDT
eukprot:2712311-Amphidinium_carterae.1